MPTTQMEIYDTENAINVTVQNFPYFSNEETVTTMTFD